MRLTSGNIHTLPPRGQAVFFPRLVVLAAYAVTFLLAALAIHLVVSAAMHWGQVRLDDLRYGRPRTTHLHGMVGHEGARGQPTHFVAINMQGQVVVLELPGGDASMVRSLPGPYLFGDDAALTPILLELRDVDQDTLSDLLISVRNEQIVYLNRDGAFRLPTPEEQATLNLNLEQGQGP